MFSADEPIPDYQKAVRERASASLGGVRNAFSSPVKPTCSPQDGYSIAVARLKDLIGRYDQSRPHLGSKPQLLHLPDQHPLGGARSRLRTELPAGGAGVPGLEELTHLLNSQSAVVEHLEDREEFYKDALAALKQRTELLVQENQTLYEQLKYQTGRLSEIQEAADFKHDGPEDEGVEQQTAVLTVPVSTGKSTIEGSAGGGGTPADAAVGDGRQGELEDSQLFLSLRERKFVSQLEDEVDKIRKLHQGKTRHLESLLYSTRDELEDYQRQVSELEGKLRDQEVLREQQHDRPTMCVKCAHQQAVLSSGYGDAAMKTMRKMGRDRDELVETLGRQKAALAEARQRELEAYSQVKKSCDTAEQSQLEKAQAIIQVQQLRDEISGQRERHEKMVTSLRDKSEAECQKVRATCREEVDELLKKMESQMEACAALENQLERTTREKVSLASELEQANAQITAQSVDVSKVTDGIRQELSDAIMKQTQAAREVASLKAAAQQATREREQEKVRMTTEMAELRRRLHEAEAAWVESRDECVQLAENWNRVQREVKTAAVAKRNSECAREEDLENFKKQIDAKDKHLTVFAEQEQARQAEFKMEAENIWEANNQFINQMKDEYQKLTEKVRDTSLRSRAKVQDARKSSEKWKTKLRECQAELRSAELEIASRDDRIRELTAKLRNNDNGAKKYAQQVQQLLTKQTNLSRERQMLRLEVEYLRSQLCHVPPLDGVTGGEPPGGRDRAEQNENLKSA